MNSHVVVVGAGITGLAAAYRLLQKCGPRVQITIVERAARIGGNIATERAEGFVLDGGPDAFVTTKPQALELCADLGIRDRVIDTIAENRRVYVMRKKRLWPLPEGMFMIAPTAALPIARSRLLSLPGKLRMACDLVVPARRDEGDESIGAFVRRRFGNEAVERLAEPLLGGIYAGSVDKLSLDSTFPQLRDLERRHGSVIRGARQMATHAKPDPKVPRPSRSVFGAMRGGMGELVEVLKERLETAGVTFRLSAQVESLSSAGAGRPGEVEIAIRDRDGGVSSLVADHVVLTCPTYEAASLIRGIDEELASCVDQVPYVSTATVLLGFERSAIGHPLDASGVIVPRVEGKEMLAVTFVTSKWQERAPEGRVLLRAFFGGDRDPEAAALSDNDLVERALSGLGPMLSIQGQPVISRVFRFQRRNPQPLVGHGDRLNQAQQMCGRYPFLHFAGAGYGGVGIPDCIRQANEVSQRISERLSK